MTDTSPQPSQAMQPSLEGNWEGGGVAGFVLQAISDSLEVDNRR